MYEYKAIVTEVYDGDTVTVDIDLGLGVWVRGEKVRLYGINAPEMRGPDKDAGTASRDYLRELVLGKEILLETIKDSKGKYGRYLGKLWLQEDTPTGPIRGLINSRMVLAGHAVFKEY